MHNQLLCSLYLTCDHFIWNFAAQKDFSSSTIIYHFYILIKWIHINEWVCFMIIKYFIQWRKFYWSHKLFWGERSLFLLKNRLVKKHLSPVSIQHIIKCYWNVIFVIDFYEISCSYLIHSINIYPLQYVHQWVHDIG